jgi:hypothetical protein
LDAGKRESITALGYHFAITGITDRDFQGRAKRLPVLYMLLQVQAIITGIKNNFRR